MGNKQPKDSISKNSLLSSNVLRSLYLTVNNKSANEEAEDVTITKKRAKVIIKRLVQKIQDTNFSNESFELAFVKLKNTETLFAIKSQKEEAEETNITTFTTNGANNASDAISFDAFCNLVLMYLNITSSYDNLSNSLAAANKKQKMTSYGVAITRAIKSNEIKHLIYSKSLSEGDIMQINESLHENRSIISISDSGFVKKYCQRHFDEFIDLCYSIKSLPTTTTCNITSINFSQAGIAKEISTNFCEAMSNLTALKTIDVSLNDFSNTSPQILSRLIQPSLRHLNINHCELSHITLAIIIQQITATCYNLAVLQISNNNSKHNHANSITSNNNAATSDINLTNELGNLLKCAKLTRLNIKSLQELDLEKFTTDLKYAAKLQVLNISYVRGFKCYLQQLETAIMATPIKELYATAIANNLLDKNDTSIICNIMHKNSLKVLNIEKVNLDITFPASLAYNTNLRKLVVSTESITFANNLLQTLETNSTLLDLSLYTSSHEALDNNVATYFQTNSTLQHLRLITRSSTVGQSILNTILSGNNKTLQTLTFPSSTSIYCDPQSLLHALEHHKVALYYAVPFPPACSQSRKLLEENKKRAIFGTKWVAHNFKYYSEDYQSEIYGLLFAWYSSGSCFTCVPAEIFDLVAATLFHLHN